MVYDLIVIGAGSGGVRASRMAAQTGAKVAVVEDKALGGTCVNVGCVPKKMMVYASACAQEFKDAKGYGWKLESGEFDWTGFITKKDNEISRLNGIYGNILDGANVELLTGRGALLKDDQQGNKQVEVSLNGEKTVYSAKTILLAPGGKPFVPEFPGHDLCITSDEVFYLPKQPKSMLVVGGGYIAVEFASIFNGFGTKTTLSYRSEQILRGFDNDVRDFTAEEMRKAGVDIKVNLKPVAIEIVDGQKKVTFNDQSVAVYDEVLFATGRVAASDQLGLENQGVELSKQGAIVVDENFKTNVDNVYALGDVIGFMQLTPVALEQGMAWVKYKFGNDNNVKFDGTNIATAVFCQPNIATVGLNEIQASEQGLDVDVYIENFKPLAGTINGNEGRMLMKMLVNKSDDKVIGLHMVGAGSGEIMQGFAVALKAGATKAQFDATVGIHPTAAEEFVTMRTPQSK